MEQGLKERLTGAAVLVVLAVIFIPMLLDDSDDSDLVISETNIPARPDDMPVPPEMTVPESESEFTSRVIPLNEHSPPEQAKTGTAEVSSPETMPEPVVETVAEPAGEVAAPAQPVTEAPTVVTEAVTVQPSAATPARDQQSTTAVMRNEDSSNDVGLSAWVVQLGSFSSAANAESLNQKLRKAGFRSFVEPLQKDGQSSYRVRVGPELKRSDAQAINDKLKKSLQLQGIVVQYP